MLGTAAVIDGLLLTNLFRERMPTPVQRVFIHMVLGTALWNISVLLYLVSHASIFVSFVYTAAIYFIAARYTFVRTYTKTATPQAARYTLIAGLLLAAAAWIPNMLVRNAHISPEGYVIVENGYLTILFTIFVVYATIHPIMLLYRFSQKHPEARAIFIGLTIYAGVATLLSNLILPVFFNVYYLNTIGPAFSTIFTAFVFYAIFRYQFLHIKILMQRGIIFSVLFGVVLCGYGLLMSALVRLVGDIAPLVQYLIGAGAILLGVIYAQRLERWLQNVTDPIFMQRTYSYQNTVRELTHIFATHSTSRALLNASLRFLKQTLHVRRITFSPHAVVHLPQEQTASIVLSVPSSQGVHGTLIVSHKRSLDPFTPTDHELLTLYATILGIGLDKARLFENLEGEVAARTREIAELRAAERTRYAALAHEIKTPLTVLSGTYELFQNAHDITRADVDTFGRSIEKTKRAVHDMLEISRIAAAKQAHHTRVDLTALVVGIAEYVETICTMEHVGFAASIAPDCWIVGDTRDLELLINNILSNAVRYTKLQPNPHIFLELAQNEAEIILTVKDNGIGIDPGDLLHIFEHGRRGKNTADIAGSGIGLAIAKEIADAHHATIHVESTSGHGTTATLRFPR